MKISIGVPIYNVEKYIERCAESLFKQTYTDIEYVFINDCTPDKSMFILQSVIDRYPERINQVKIVNHNRNRGLGAARNTGLMEMTGEFLLWVDSDDYVASDLVEKVVKCQQQTEADMVCFDHFRETESRKTNVKTIWPQDKSKIIKAVLMGAGDIGSIWGRLIRRSLYIDHSIKVKEGFNMSEDLQVLPKLMFYANRIVRVDEPLYYYNCCNTSSYTASFSEDKGKQSLEATKILYDFFLEHDIQYLDYVQKRRIMTLTGLSYGCGSNKSHKTFSRFLRDEINKIDKSCYSIIPFPRSIPLYIKNYSLFWFAIRTVGLVKHN